MSANPPLHKPCCLEFAIYALLGKAMDHHMKTWTFYLRSGLPQWVEETYSHGMNQVRYFLIYLQNKTIWPISSRETCFIYTMQALEKISAQAP